MAHVSKYRFGDPEMSKYKTYKDRQKEGIGE